VKMRRGWRNWVGSPQLWANYYLIWIISHVTVAEWRMARMRRGWWSWVGSPQLWANYCLIWIISHVIVAEWRRVRMMHGWWSWVGSPRLWANYYHLPCDCCRVEKGEDEAWLVELGGRALIWLGDLTRYTLDLLGHDEQGRMTC
jgi:hypothetical protein